MVARRRFEVLVASPSAACNCQAMLKELCRHFSGPDVPEAELCVEYEAFVPSLPPGGWTQCSFMNSFL